MVAALPARGGSLTTSAWLITHVRAALAASGEAGTAVNYTYCHWSYSRPVPNFRKVHMANADETINTEEIS
jgi:hypothetical protein